MIFKQFNVRQSTGRYKVYIKEFANEKHIENWTHLLETNGAKIIGELDLPTSLSATKPLNHAAMVQAIKIIHNNLTHHTENTTFIEHEKGNYLEYMQYSCTYRLLQKDGVVQLYKGKTLQPFVNTTLLIELLKSYN